VRFDLQLILVLFKCFVKTFIHTWWSADPDLFDISSIW